jgi:acyl-CoA reductase-like NAD-dependent aldehyde dehydrogenase
MKTIVYNFINNELQNNFKGDFFDKKSPLNNSIISSVVRSTQNEVDQAVKAARDSFKEWSSFSSVKRGDILYSIVDEIIKAKEEFAQIMHLETGKSLKDAYGEIQAAIAQGRFMAAEGTRLGGRSIPCAANTKRVMTIREPVGVCALMVSFNTPIANLAWKIFPALICGNTIVLKSSEETPAIANLFAQVCAKAGLPKGVLNIVHGIGSECGHSLINHKDIQLISFTGSTKVGKLISQACAGKLTKVFLELGGKNPMVICADADLDNAVKWAIQSSFSNAGQRCASSSRILVEESIYETFKNKFIEETSKLKVGSKDTDDIGPVISEGQMNKLIQWSKQAQDEGGKILLGGKSALDQGAYLAPTILENIKLNSELSCTEMFGPLTILYKFKDLNEAIEISNSSQYGLTSCIHTSNFNKAFEFCTKVQAGVATVNGGTHGSEPHLPFGGVKDSGNGFREPGIEALDIYSNWKNIVFNY